MNEKYVLTALEASAFHEKSIGGKAKNLAWLTRNSFPVPEWFVITTSAFSAQLNENNLYSWITGELKKLENDTSGIREAAFSIQEKIVQRSLLDDISGEIINQLKSFKNRNDEYFSVRSSAIGEDSRDISFAGQLDSFLYQRGEEAVLRSVLKVFASAYSERAITYRLNNNISLLDISTAVIIQRMVNSTASGVFFTAHPVTGSRKTGLISACYGTGESVVSGLCNTDEFTVDRSGNHIKKTIGEKDFRIILDSTSKSGTMKADVPVEQRNVQCIGDKDIQDIIRHGIRISELMQSPQDIEWTFENDKLYILQTRPITSLPAPAEPRGKTVVWDNSNIQESFCGVTTPLTFSFASGAYYSVYRQTYQLLGVPPEVIKELDSTYRNLLGLIKGRVYYNINNWYRALLILPSFKTNKADMERMMGLQDPVDFVEEQNPGFYKKLKKMPALFRALFRLLSGFKKIDRLVSNFHKLFNRVYKSIDRSKLHTLEIAELMDLRDSLKFDLMGNWQTPIINDFYVMMMNGKVSRMLEKTGIENPAVLQNNLMSGEQGIESTEPTKFLLRLCDDIRKNPALMELFHNNNNENMLAIIQTLDNDIYKKCMEYIELYGDRCMGELKLESTTLRQNPSFMFAVLKNFLSREDLTAENLASREMEFRLQAEKEAFSTIRNKLGKRKLKKFKKVLGKLRHAVKNRENMRLARTRAFGLARDIYLEIGNQLDFYNILENPGDIFYLTEEELETYMDGRCVQADYKSLVKSRKAEYQRYENEELPHHFSTKGPVYHHNEYIYQKKDAEKQPSDILKGTGCYPGIVENDIKLIFSPEDELNLDGKILCTVRTDPGWAPLFPTAGGILVERGSTLSHSAVVARELGIPAIVNIPGLTKQLNDGERVRMDGTKGIVEQLKSKNDRPECGKEEK